MPISRRSFVRSVALSALAGSALSSAWAQPGVTAAKDDTFAPENLVALNGISMKTFQSLAGESFTVSSSKRALGSMTLLSVIAFAPPATPSTKMHVLVVGPVPRTPIQTLSSFSVRFQGSGAALPQGTYTLANNSLGSFPLLLVPSGLGSSPNTYTAVFNLLLATGPRPVPLQKEAILAPTR